jgi:predicted DsbA family dithiol-disulfide isomerase
MSAKPGEAPPMTQALKIDFVSDIACPRCVIGLGRLEKALDAMHGEVEAGVCSHPFELNPTMPSGGQNILEHVIESHGITLADARANRERIRERAADVGFTMNRSDESRIYNTFDAHRLLAWEKDERPSA